MVMRKIYAPETPPGKKPRREPWLEAATLRDSQGREYSVPELRQQCRRDYGSVCLKKTNDGRMGYRKRSPQEVIKIAQMTVDDIAILYQLTREQASLLKYRCLGKVKLGVY
jgi:hypothetical protein